MLRGNVVMTDPNSRLVTEELLYDLANKSARYTTGGKIVSKSNTLESVFGQYASEKRMFYFKKKVKLENPKYTMVCDTLQYATISEIAYFQGPTTITSKDNEIYCEQGFYNTKTDQSEFIKNAKFSSSGQIIEADTLRYNQKTAEGTALRNISITDTTEKVVLRGNRAFYNEKSGKTLVTENAEMQRQFGKDTLFLHADTLRSVLDTTSKKRNLLAYHRAQFYKSDFQGRCDSLTFSESDSMMRLYRDPVIWNDENQLTADTIRIQLANDQLDKLYLIKAGFISSQVDSLHFNQISGKKITGYFEKNDLDRVLVEGNGESIYFAEDDDNSYIGVNKAFCSHMMIYLDSSKIKSINFYQQPDATLFPVADLSEEEMKLKGLIWLGQVRPNSRNDIFIWKALPPRESIGRKRIKK
jgi:lipopolysaccharide export system protein LptA